MFYTINLWRNNYEYIIMSKINAVRFSQEVQHQALYDESSLIDALISVCDQYEVPHEEVCRCEVDDETINLITPQLKEKMEAECASLRLIIGKSANSASLSEYI